MIVSFRPLGLNSASLMRAIAVPVLAMLFCQTTRAEEARVGRKIDNFVLNDSRGGVRSLSDWADSKLVVVAFLGTECPLANLDALCLAEIAGRWASKGVTFVGVNSNQQDSITEVATHAGRHAIPFPMCKDPANRIADLLCRPHAGSVRS